MANNARDLDTEERRQWVRDATIEGHAWRELLPWLRDADWRVRRETAERLAHVRDAGALSRALVEIIVEDDDVGARNAAIALLAALGPHAVDAVVEKLPLAGGRSKFLLEAASEFADERVASAILAATESEDLNLQIVATECLRKLPRQLAEGPLRKLLRSPMLQKQLAACEGLSDLQVPVNVSDVEELLLNPLLRRGAIELLAYSNDLEAPSHLAALWARSPRMVAGALARTLASLMERGMRMQVASALDAYEAVDASLCAIIESDVAVAERRAAVALLGLRKQCPDVLVGCLVDAALAEASAQALREIGPGACDTLVAQLAFATGEQQIELIDLLAELAPQSQAAADALAPLLDDEDELVAASAARALANCGVAGTCARLASVVKEEARSEVAAAALTSWFALAGSGLAAAPSLADYVRSEHADVRMAVVNAAHAQGNVDILRGCLRDSSRRVKLRAAQALSECGARNLVVEMSNDPDISAWLLGREPAE